MVLLDRTAFGARCALSRKLCAARRLATHFVVATNVRSMTMSGTTGALTSTVFFALGPRAAPPAATAAAAAAGSGRAAMLAGVARLVCEREERVSERLNMSGGGHFETRGGPVRTRGSQWPQLQRASSRSMPSRAPTFCRLPTVLTPGDLSRVASQRALLPPHSHNQCQCPCLERRRARSSTRQRLFNRSPGPRSQPSTLSLQHHQAKRSPRCRRCR